VNDTTNAALKAGVDLAEGRCPTTKGTTCQMHAQELVTSHAMGIRERSKNLVSVDNFAPGKNLRNSVKALVSRIMDKRAKGRFKEYNNISMKYLRIKALKLEIPNETRVSGIYNMFLSALRSRKLIVIFLDTCKEPAKFADVELSDVEWQFLAECEALLRTMDVLAMNSQKDDVTGCVFSYFYVARSRFLMKKISMLNVVDLSKNQWTHKDDFDCIPKILTPIEDLQADTLTLIKRFEVEFQRYFPHPDSDQVMMMVFHPIMIWRGFWYVKLLSIYTSQFFSLLTNDLPIAFFKLLTLSILQTIPLRKSLRVVSIWYTTCMLKNCRGRQLLPLIGIGNEANTQEARYSGGNDRHR
jgi:hypothetical protein